jgi:hypothetical protein
VLIVSKAIFYVMSAIVFSFVGMLILVGILAAGHLSGRVPPLTLTTGIRFAVSIAGLILIGLGLLALRKWAALIFSLLTLYLAFWTFNDAIHSVPWSRDGIGYWFSLLLITPIAMTLKFWRTLTWHGNKHEIKNSG